MPIKYQLHLPLCHCNVCVGKFMTIKYQFHLPRCHCDVYNIPMFLGCHQLLFLIQACCVVNSSIGRQRNANIWYVWREYLTSRTFKIWHTWREYLTLRIWYDAWSEIHTWSEILEKQISWMQKSIILKNLRSLKRTWGAWKAGTTWKEKWQCCQINKEYFVPQMAHPLNHGKMGDKKTHLTWRIPEQYEYLVNHSVWLKH